MKLKFRADPHDLLVFGIFAGFLLYVVAIVVSNLASFATEGTLSGFNPFPAFEPRYILTTLMLFILALGALFISVSSYFFDREKGLGLTTEKKDKGYSRWAKDKEIKEELECVPVQAKRAKAAGIPLIVTKEELWVDNGEYHSLIIGATGSGKSTTVYSILQKMNTEEVNIITVEDPIEMDIAGINQVQAQSEIGLTFANVLRSILRQDPDVIMIGEIRDDETARIAVRASITGHKVLSTIHTNNSLNTIERLTDMDVERYLLGSALTGIISQKLARRLCPHCKILRNTSEYEKTVFRKVLHKDIEQMYDANPDGCEHCFRGFTDRIAILEVLLMNDDIRDAITNNMHKDELRKLVYKSDVITLLQDGLIKVVEGETSFSEILKVVDLDNDLSNYEDDNLETGIRDIENQETNTNINHEINKPNINHEINKPDIQEIDAFNPDDHYVSLEPVTTNNNEIIDYSALIPKDVENHNNEIPHDTIKPGEIEYFNF